ncbi:DNA polymerase III [Fibrobacterales bacterium]|nr:DNA polymerase III [Fibrobacterales bacterium]
MSFKVIEIGEDGYPPLLSQSKFAPQKIYVAGEYNFADKFCLAMVGTRTPSNLAVASVDAMVSSISQKNVLIVSGLAQGIDSLCHEAALKYKLKTAAIIGQGLNVPLSGSQRILAEKILANGGSIISIFPLDTHPEKWTFIKRNRIISGMSNAVILVESRVKGGAMHTANFCLNDGKKLYALPSNPLYEASQGGNKLIYEGKATPIWNFKELPNILGFNEQLSLFSDCATEGLSGDLDWIERGSIHTIEEICEQSGKTYSEILSILTEMEMQGQCSVQDGQRVIF